MSVREDPTKRAGDPAEEPQPDAGPGVDQDDEASEESFPASDPPQTDGGIA